MKYSNAAGVVDAIREAAKRLHPEFKEPQERARDHLAAAADLYRESGEIEAFKRTKNLLTRLTPKEPKQ